MSDVARNDNLYRGWHTLAEGFSIRRRLQDAPLLATFEPPSGGVVAARRRRERDALRSRGLRLLDVQPRLSAAGDLVYVRRSLVHHRAFPDLRRREITPRAVGTPLGIHAPEMDVEGPSDTADEEQKLRLRPELGIREATVYVALEVPGGETTICRARLPRLDPWEIVTTREMPAGSLLVPWGLRVLLTPPTGEPARLTELEGGRVLHEKRAPPVRAAYGACIDPARRVVWFGGSEGLWRWDLKSGRYDEVHPEGGACRPAPTAPRGRVWYLRNGCELWMDDGETRECVVRPGPSHRGHCSDLWMKGVDVSPDGRFVAAVLLHTPRHADSELPAIHSRLENLGVDREHWRWWEARVEPTLVLVDVERREVAYRDGVYPDVHWLPQWTGGGEDPRQAVPVGGPAGGAPRPRATEAEPE